MPVLVPVPAPDISKLLASAALLLALGGCANDCNKSNVSVADGSGLTATGATMADAAPLNVTPVPQAALLKIVNPSKLPAYVGPTGSVEGTIFVIGEHAAEVNQTYMKCPAAASTYDHTFREGPESSPGAPRWLADAVVAITGYSDFFVPERDEAEEITIADCAFTRRSVTMTFGQRLEVKNLSKDFWTPMLQPSGSGVMMMAPPGGDPVKLYPKAPGRLLLTDHDRKYATVDVFVLAHPLHTTSALQGTYRIDGIPVGKVKVNTTHPQIDNSDAAIEVEIQPGVVHKVDLTLRNAPAPHEDAGARDANADYPSVH